MAIVNARTVGRRTVDLDADRNAALFLPSLQDEVACPLHLIRAPGEFHHGLSPASVSALEVASDAEGAAYSPIAWMDPDDWVDWSMPRDMPARVLPATGKPRVRVWRNRLLDLGYVRDGRVTGCPGQPVGLVVAGAVHAVVHVEDGLPDGDDVDVRRKLEWLAQASEFLACAGWDRPVRVVATDGSRLGGTRLLRELARPVAAWRRFHYSYAVNFSAMALPLLEGALATEDPEAAASWNRRYARARSSREAHLHARVAVEIRQGTRGFLDPLTLQAMYALRRAGSVEVGDTAPGDPGWDMAVATAGDPDGMWRGTGKHPPRRISRVEAAMVAGRLFAMLLVVWKDGRVRPSRVAGSFLDALHPACEDVDVPLRWHGAWHGRGEGEVAAVDAWIARTFAKMAAGRTRT